MKILLNSFYVILAIVCFCGCSLFYPEKPPVKPIQESAAPNPAPEPVKSSVSFYDASGQARKLDLKKYPNAHTILLDDVESVKYNSDGTYTRSDESWTLIVTEAGRKDMRTVTLHFNEFYQKVPQIDIEVIKPDGRVIKPVLQKNITIESSQMQSNIYDPANKVLTLGIPDLEIGDIVHSKWVMQTIKPRMKGVWCDIALLQTTSPVLHYVYTISAPENAPLKSIAVKDEVKGTLKKSVTRADGRILYRYEVKDVPQIITEPDMPPYYLHAMRVLTSTAPDWQTVSRWYYNLCEPRIKAVSPELTAHVRKLTAGKKGKEAVRALFDFVSKEIRYTGVTNEDSAPGYEPHDVKDTFAQKHGVCRDKAALLVAMLREGGFDACMVLFMAGDPKDPEIPNNYFNHAITGVKMPDGELILMDPTDENSRDLLPAYAMDKSFLCATSKGDVLRRTPVVDPAKNMMVIRSTGKLDENYQLTLKSELVFNGFNDNIYRSAFARWPQEYRQQFIASALKKALPGSEVLGVKILPEDIRDLAKPFTLIIESRIPGYVDIKWGAGALRMPFLSKAFGALNFMVDENMLKARRYPLQLSSTAGVDEKCEINLPPTLVAVALPDSKNVSNKVMKVKKSVGSQGGKLLAERFLTLEKVEISAAEYPAFRKTVQNLAASDNDNVIIKRSFAGKDVAFAGAPAVLVDSRTTVDIDSKSVMKIDYFRKIKVQNYSGVKDNSEMILDYIPSISSCRVIAGKVTAPDGSVTALDLKTIQLMDDDESTAAPRYPVGKMMVVPFPGVKPGSVIELQWQKTFTGASAMDFVLPLWCNMPTMQRAVEIKYPASLQKKVKLKLPAAGFKVEKSFANKQHTIKVYASNIPMMPHEVGTPPEYLFAPYVGISTFDAVSYCNTVRSAIEKAAANAPESSALAVKLTSQIPDVPGKVKAIRDYVEKNIRHAGWGMNKLNLNYITQADITLREGYGNSLDRAVLLYSMLKSINIKNIDIILLSYMPQHDKVWAQFAELPQNFFENVVLSVKEGYQELLLNDNDEYSPLEYIRSDGYIGLNTANGEIVNLRSGNDCQDGIRNDWVIKLLPGGSAEFNRTVSYYGGEYVSRNRYFANITPEKERQYWEQQFSGVLAGAELLEKSRDFKLYPGQIKMRFTVPNFWRQSGEYVSFTLPTSGEENLVRTAGKRTLPYCFMPKRMVQNRFAVEIPENWQLCEFDGGNYSMTLPGTGGIAAQETLFKDGLLDVMFFFGARGWIYCEPHEYSLLEELQKKLSNPAQRTFLFKTTGK